MGVYLGLNHTFSTNITGPHAQYYISYDMLNDKFVGLADLIDHNELHRSVAACEHKQKPAMHSPTPAAMINSAQLSWEVSVIMLLVESQYPGDVKHGVMFKS